jgi:type IV pilus assembly protein PilN
MIRINLIATERKTKAASKGLNVGQKMTVIGSLVLILATLGIGWRYWALEQSAAGIERQLTDARREEQRLAAILKQVREFEARREVLQQRATLIDELRRGQTAPVHIIDQMSRALPEMTWLTRVQQTGFDVTMEGRCLTLTSLSDFIGNLEASRYFKRPVEILSSEVVTGDNGGPDTIRFTIKGSFQMAGIEQIAVEAPAGKGRAAAKKAPAKGGPRG